jgi:PKD repeat protein
MAFDLVAEPENSLLKILDNGVDMGNEATYLLSNITEDHLIEAYFTGASEFLTITPYSNEGGTIVPSGPQTVPRGANITFVVTADSCHTIGSNVVTDITNALSPQEGPFTSPKNVTFENVQISHDMTVQFDQKGYTINVTQAQGGAIDPAGTGGLVPVACGDDVTFTITPNAGNSVENLIVDDVLIPGKGEHTFEDVVDNHSFSAVFVLPPDPDFGAHLTRVPPKYPVTFKDLTKHSPTSVLWDFGDGEISADREPTHYYAKTGFYDITLTAWNAAAPQTGVSVTKSRFIEVTTDPIAKFTVDKVGGKIPPGFAVQMTDLSLNAETKDKVTFAWDFGDGKGSSIGRNPSYTYTAPGVYKVGLKVEKPYIVADWYYQTITVLQEPVADFIAHPISGPAPLAVQFEDKSQGFPTSWFWTFNDGQGSYDYNPQHVFATPGVYTVSLSVSSDEGNDTKTIEQMITVT